MSDHQRGRGHGHDMTNSHLLVHGFDYYEPAALEEAVSLLAQHGHRAQVMAGGTNLIVWMKMEQVAPMVVVNVGKLPGLEGITTSAAEGRGLEIGALTKIWDLRNAPALQTDYTALADACAAFGSTQIQLMGTIGGNVCNGSPASDSVPALVALRAQLVLVGPEGERLVPLEEFLVGPGQVALQDGEMLTTIRIPESRPGAATAFVKVSRVRADLAKASAAAMIVRDGDE
ncbi:MAG: FAD binding domain-containing protein, partial [Anaerolineae bacterium]